MRSPMEERTQPKKLLLVANVVKEHVLKFHVPTIRHLKEQGWTVDVACRMDVSIPECDTAYDLPCNRNPFRGGLGKSVKRLREILKKNPYKGLTALCMVPGYALYVLWKRKYG